MAKRKYTRFGEKPTAYKCTKKACGWEGKKEDKEEKSSYEYMTESTCPKCGNNEFYGIL